MYVKLYEILPLQVNVCYLKGEEACRTYCRDHTSVVCAVCHKQITPHKSFPYPATQTEDYIFLTRIIT